MLNKNILTTHQNAYCTKRHIFQLFQVSMKPILILAFVFKLVTSILYQHYNIYRDSNEFQNCQTQYAKKLKDIKKLIKVNSHHFSLSKRCSLIKISLILPVTTSTAFSPFNMCIYPTFLLQYSRKGIVCSLQVLNRFLIVQRLSSSLPLLFPLSSNLASRVSNEHSRQIKVLTSTSVPITFCQASQFSALLGNPSIRQTLLFGPFLKMFLLMMSTSISLGANLPYAMIALILAASSQSDLINSLNRSPVEQWTKPYLLIIMSHCVPFPAPGPPSMKIILGLFSEFILSLCFSTIQSLQFDFMTSPFKQSTLISDDNLMVLEIIRIVSTIQFHTPQGVIFTQLTWKIQN